MGIWEQNSERDIDLQGSVRERTRKKPTNSDSNLLPLKRAAPACVQDDRPLDAVPSWKIVSILQGAYQYERTITPGSKS